MVVKKKATSKVATKKSTAVTKAVKKSTAPKATKPKSATAKKLITKLVNQSKEHKLAVWKETETANELVMKDWGSRLATTKATMDKLNKKYEELAFPQISRQLILSTMNQRGAYETNQIHSRVQIRGCQTNP